MNAVELIKETVEFYRTNPRSKNRKDPTGQCQYVTTFPDGKKTYCALGRMLSEDTLSRIETESTNSSSAGELFNDLIPQYVNGDQALIHSLLKEEYRHKSIDYWLIVELQSLHDEDRYWTEVHGASELTSRGEDFVNRLIKNYQ